MYDAKSTNSKSEKGDRPKSADLSQQVVKTPPGTGSTIKASLSASHPAVPSPPASPSTHATPDRASSPASPAAAATSPHTATQLNFHRLTQKSGRISSVTLVPRVPVGATSPSRPLVPPPPSDFEIYKDEQVRTR